MKIFLDNHHEELTESLRILFEDRMGWEVYRPIGLEWYHEGYWHIYPALATAEQYLGLHVGKALQQKWQEDPSSIEHHRHFNPNVLENSDGIYDIGSVVYPNKRYLGITLERFKSTPFDVILSSIPSHARVFNELIQLYQPQAKHIFQVGNNWTYDFPVKNILSSSKLAFDSLSTDKHAIFYHQEFSLQTFSFVDSFNPTSIYNMLHYMKDTDKFFEVEKRLPGWLCKCHGAGNREKSRGPSILDVANCFREMGFLWHVKREGDGYGYNVFHAAARGRPIITRCKHYQGMTAAPLLVHGETCLDLDQCNIVETVQKLQEMAGNYSFHSQAIHDKFKQQVDFDEEAKQIKNFLENLQ